MRTDYAQMLEQGTNEATDVHDHSHGLRRFRLHLQPIRLRVLRIHEERGVDRRANVAQVPAAEEGTADRYAETSDEAGEIPEMRALVKFRQSFVSTRFLRANQGKYTVQPYMFVKCRVSQQVSDVG